MRALMTGGMTALLVRFDTAPQFVAFASVQPVILYVNGGSPRTALYPIISEVSVGTM